MSRSKIVLALLALTLFATIGASAQSLPALGNTDGRIFSVDFGMATGYSLSANDAIVGRTFGVNFTVTENLAVGFANTLASGNQYNLFRFGYYLTPAIGFNVYVGSNAAHNVATGAGAFVTILKTKADTTFISALKIRVEYLFDVNGAGEGDIVLAVVPSIGL
jgi:hypothetical protein